MPVIVSCVLLKTDLVLRTRSVSLKCASQDCGKFPIRQNICWMANPRMPVVRSLEGTRPLLVEIQALVCHSAFGMPRRTAAGVDYNRVNLLMAVLEKNVGVRLADQDAYINIAGGMKVSEPATDLGLVLAIISSFRNRPIAEDMICFGEVGLSGEVRSVNMVEQRIAEAHKLGFKQCILPKVCMKNIQKPDGMLLKGVENVREALEIL